MTGHVVVVGGGIAGASAAYFLSADSRCESVTLIEAERQLAQHTTGRSAALLTENYGAGPIRPLTTASLAFLRSPPEGLADHELVTPRGMMTVSFERDSHARIDDLLRDTEGQAYTVAELDREHAAELAPHVVFGSDVRALWEPDAADIDVAGLHQAFVRGLRTHGGRVETAHRLDTAHPAGSGWEIETTGGTLRADVLVNAAGAWGDAVATAAGVAPVGLMALRRTAFMVDSPIPGSAEVPVVAEANHDWYIRPDGSQFMCSPADETPSEPCDAKAEELDIARTIDMVNQHTRLEIRSVRSHWAGLRTFSPDRAMVIGPEPGQENFIWCVGQGGTGIQTSPGAGRLIADLVVDGRPSGHFDGTGLNLGALLPDRYR